jgi:hypothetical protein
MLSISFQLTNVKQVRKLFSKALDFFMNQKIQIELVNVFECVCTLGRLLIKREMLKKKTISKIELDYFLIIELDDHVNY